LVESGDVYLDLTLSDDGRGGCKDHGFLWRIKSEALDRLYLSRAIIDLAKDDRRGLAIAGGKLLNSQLV
jgi:hypothetical protein